MGIHENEQILTWLDDLRDGVANQNSTAEHLARKAMDAVRHVHVANQVDDACAQCGLDLRNTFVHVSNF